MFRVCLRHNTVFFRFFDIDFKFPKGLRFLTTRQVQENQGAKEEYAFDLQAQLFFIVHGTPHFMG